jgi:hypothetical protein
MTRRSRQILGIGSLVFGAWGLVHPRSLTDLMGDDPGVGRLLGLRDTLVGVALLMYNDPGPLIARMLSDMSDAVRLRDRSPAVAAGALAFAAWSGITAATLANAPRA